MDRPVRLLVAVPTPPPYAGPEVGMEALLRHWSSKRVQLFHVRTTLRESNAEKGRLDWKGVGKFIRVWWRYWRALWRWCPQVVFLLLSSSWVGFFRDVLLIVTARLCRSRIFVQYRGGNFSDFYRSRSRWQQGIIRWGLQHVRRVFVQSEGLREQFRGIVPWERLGVLPNGICIAAFPERRRKVAERTPYRLLFVGHIAFAKGFRELSRAYRQLVQEFPLELRVVGTRITHRQVARSFLPLPWREYYDTHADEIEAEIDRFLSQAAVHNVRLLGIVSPSAVYEQMVEADLLVLPSYSEGFSMAVLEAMAAGLPVVVTPVGALKELVVDGVHGKIVPVGDEEKLAAALRACLQQPEWMQQVGEHNRRVVAERYTLERVLARLEEEVWRAVWGDESP